MSPPPPSLLLSSSDKSVTTLICLCSPGARGCISMASIGLPPSNTGSCILPAGLPPRAKDSRLASGDHSS
eukprot:3936626-Rhodomonas_salina.5